MNVGDDVDRCETIADIQARDGQRVAVVGSYEQVDVRQRKTGDPVYRGHAAVVMRDGRKVYLEPTWSPEAKRSDDEIERFEGRQVAVVGLVHLEPPEPPREVAYIVAPCVSPVDRVEPVD